MGGASPAEGRLEMYFNDTWNVMCDTYWDNSYSQLVCDQLGFYGNATTGYYGEFGYYPYYGECIRCKCVCVCVCV